MSRKFAVFAAALAAVALSVQGAQAGGSKLDATALTAVEIGVGAAATAGYFGLHHRHHALNHNINTTSAIALTTIGCMALSPIVGTIVVNRQLTTHEVHAMTASCIIPIVGGWLVDAAYAAHPEWEGKVKVAHHHHKKKM